MTEFKIDIEEIPEELKSSYISRFFIETCKGHTNLLSWLQSIDVDTLEMIIQCSQKDIYAPNTKPETLEEELDEADEADENQGYCTCDACNMDEDEDIDSGSDIYTLSFLVESMELGNDIYYDELVDAMEKSTFEHSSRNIKNLCVMAVFERFRRNGLLNINGSGKMTASEDTRIKVTCEMQEIVKFVQETGLGQWMLEP